MFLQMLNRNTVIYSINASKELSPNSTRRRHGLPLTFPSMFAPQPLDDVTLQTINLSDTIGKARTFNQRKTQVNDENVYFLPKDFNSSEKDHRSDFILPLFSKPCQSAGFRLITKGWEWYNNCIVFACSRCKHSTNPIFHSKPKKKTPHQTEKPVGDHLQHSK